MNKLRSILVLCAGILYSGLSAQDLSDALRFNNRELTGTARTLSMANAFGALGGDLSAISINPAGIAVYRTSEFAFTPSFSVNHNNASYGQFKNSEDEFSFPLNQIGFVSTNRTLREKSEGLVSTHFGFTYNRTSDFNFKSRARMGSGVTDLYGSDGSITANTLLTNLMLEANGYMPEELSNRSFFAYDTYLINPLFDNSTEYYSEYEHIVDIDDQNSEIRYRNLNGIDQDFLIESSGYAGEYGLTFGANISHVFMLGVSLNFQTFKYEQKQSLREINSQGFDPPMLDGNNNVMDLDYYDAYMRLNQKGFGVNGKVGMILNLNPVRIGASFHSPTFYGIDEEFWDGIESFYLNYDRYRSESSIGAWSYNYRTPYRAQGSLAFVLGHFGLLSFDYEMTDHSSAKITSKDGYSTSFDALNRQIKDELRITHDIRAGLEIKPVPFIAIRAGAAYFDSPYRDKAIDLSRWMATTGIGFRGKSFYFDLAYAQTIYDDQLYLNTDNTLWQGVYFDDAVQMSNRRHQAAFTFGFKF